ncbi:MAG: PmoA family protein [Bacteroidota bacterium]
MKKFIWVVFLSVVGITSCGQPKIEVVEVPSENKVDILVDGDLFTSYIYSQNLKKPVLWPVVTSGGNEITRQYPLKIKTGERADHPHHVGMWFNYGNVNGLDFWNNSESVPAEKAGDYGRIFHDKVEKTESGKGKAKLVVTTSWKNSQGNELLNERSEFTFSAKGKNRIIDRVTKLTAVNRKVTFQDNKEGMFAIRVTRELELPGSGKINVVGENGAFTEVDADEDNFATGNYLSSTGISGTGVWGTRAKWMKLSGKVNGEEVAVVIFDHPGNPGYPTCWHARGYGLFAANPLGQNIFSEGRETLNFFIEDDQSATFRYRLAVFSGDPTVEVINELAKEFETKL